jgi:hypothetical protein
VTKRAALILFALSVIAVPQAATAERLANPIAIFSGLDKITGSITTFQVKVDETQQFGTLAVRPRVCYSRPPEEEPKTTSFVEVDEVEPDKAAHRIFTGWMLAESPGLNAVEHPVYDVWLTGCLDPNAPKPPVEEPVDPGTLEGPDLPKDNE